MHNSVASRMRRQGEVDAWLGNTRVGYLCFVFLYVFFFFCLLLKSVCGYLGSLVFVYLRFLLFKFVLFCFICIFVC